VNEEANQRESHSTMTTAEAPITVNSTMREILEAYPGAQRALFRKYHIGGCSSCAFQPTETLAEVCQRNNSLPVDQVLEHIRASHELDEKIFVAPKELEQLRRADPAIKLLDIRSRQEFEAVHLEGSVLMSQSTMQEIMGHWPRNQTLIIIDHLGRSGLDAAAYFAGHGFEQVRTLLGGIDAWAQEIDPSLPRYRLA
jgi:rhodanese-related sulfurtransferase